ncbi:hypothetical protein BO83DRAFT_346567 [Aspergillus eucalypticola CBS 122712]|uniref:RING-type domain-containing protein n=1 Tax=Aspergillus eucalypticola (strain CBS 122712 / IBT 29274) TaxID=1448314 RepID=A0A317URX2_ASPEC|nr:uncharacterized protein BO83DRAFT_346567 [Aspergillus eucalypticola CBS 122712]PWY64089.1 hypothetical protein BO83DRAFT_346567 [Aspergillus eucalypticola CBS 122712]
MSTYEVEHNTTDPSTTTPNNNNNTTTTSNTTPHRHRRPDLSTFFSALSEITPDEARHRPHAVPVPRDVSAAFYSLAEALDVMRRDGGGGGETAIPSAIGEVEGGDENDLLTTMIQSLLSTAEMPPREVEGASEEFCDMLDRVPRTALNSSQVCPICNNPFLEDQYPLVVRLPCHPTHLFDLECVRPWLRLRGTCPLDRTDFAKQEREKVEARRKLAEEDEEEEWDGMYA